MLAEHVAGYRAGRLLHRRRHHPAASGAVSVIELLPQPRWTG
ncbi:hypothetical protein ACW180_07000 [Limosilactobacillus fermentum]